MQDTPTIFGFAANRVVAFFGPYLAVASGVVADWLVVHLHILATFHVTNSGLAQALAQATVFGFTTLVVWLGHQKWLDGFQKWAYTTGEQIAHTELPPSYATGGAVPSSAPPFEEEGPTSG